MGKMGNSALNRDALGGFAVLVLLYLEMCKLGHCCRASGNYW